MALLKQIKFDVEEIGSGKKAETKSKFTAIEMVEKALVDGNGDITGIWVSRRDAEKSFQASTGVTVSPKNGVPTGQVWLFLEANNVTN